MRGETGLRANILLLVVILLAILAVGLALHIVSPKAKPTSPANATITPPKPGVEGGSVNTSTTSASGAAGGSEAYIVILGSLGCPHCRALKSFFEREMPGTALFCSVDNRGSTCVKAFSVLFNARVTSGVPTSIVCSNSTERILAIVVGEVKDAGFWEKLLAGSSPGGEIPIYYGEEKAGYLKPKSPEEAEKLYKLLCIETLRDSKLLG